MTQQTQKTTDEEIQQLVIERLNIFPPGMKISIGSSGVFSKDELIEHVKKNDQIGKKIIEVQLSYLRSLKTGILFDE